MPPEETTGQVADSPGPVPAGASPGSLRPPPLPPPRPTWNAGDRSGRGRTTGDGWSDLPVAPWRRLAGRSFDVVFHFLVVETVFWFAFVSVHPAAADEVQHYFEGSAGRYVEFLMLSMLVTVLNAVLIGVTGTSIGKSVFGVRVLCPDLQPIGVRSAFKRELAVFVWGVGCYLAVIALYMTGKAYLHLVEKRTTSWDAGRYVVVHPREDRRLLDLIGVLLFLAVVLVRWAP